MPLHRGVCFVIGALLTLVDRARAEDEQLKTLPVAEVVTRTGRTLSAVYCRRSELKLPDGR